MRTLTGVLACACLAAAAGCGGGDPAPPASRGDQGEGSDRPRRLRAKEIVIRGDRVRPDHLYVRAGTPIFWRNRDDVPHRVVARRGARQQFRSPPIAPGDRFRIGAVERGRSRYRVTGGGSSASGDIVVY